MSEGMHTVFVTGPFSGGGWDAAKGWTVARIEEHLENKFREHESRRSWDPKETYVYHRGHRLDFEVDLDGKVRVTGPPAALLLEPIPEGRKEPFVVFIQEGPDPDDVYVGAKWDVGVGESWRDLTRISRHIRELVEEGGPSAWDPELPIHVYVGDGRKLEVDVETEVRRILRRVVVR